MNRLMTVVVLFLLSCHAVAAEKPDPRADDETAIRRAVRTYVAAFNKGDAAATAAHWSDHGEWVSPSGEKFKGRRVIQAEMAAYFAESPNRRIEIRNPTVRFLAPTVAIEEGSARVSLTGEPPSETSYMAIHVKQNDTWKLESVRETALPGTAATPATPSHREYLNELGWMIGHWVDQDESSKVDTVCEWTKNGNFITRSFAVSIEDRIEIEGTQVIGWDPDAKVIRSWMFDSEGGFGQAVWSRKGNRWIIKAARTLNGGERASSVNILTYVDRNRFTWQSMGREIAGELLPNIDEVTIVRKRSGN
jgi:uncharacterized protein (TIGR02246 family)